MHDNHDLYFDDHRDDRDDLLDRERDVERDDRDLRDREDDDRHRRDALDDAAADPRVELADEFFEDARDLEDGIDPWRDTEARLRSTSPSPVAAGAGYTSMSAPGQAPPSSASAPPADGRSSFLFDYDRDSGERVPNKARFVITGVALLAAVFFGFWVVKAAGGDAQKPDVAEAKAPADQAKGPVVKGQNLPRREPRFGAPGLEPPPEPEDAPPLPPPEPPPATPAAPAPRAPSAPDSWRTSLSVQVTREEDGDEGEDDTEPSGLGVTLVEGTEIDAVLVGKIDAPDTGLQPELNRVKAVLETDYLLDGQVVFPAGTEFLGKVQQTSDKKVHVVFHRVVLPDRTSAACKAIALDSDLAAGIRADKIEKYRRQNMLARVGRGVVDGAATVATLGRSGVGTIGAGAAGGAAGQARDEVDGARRPKTLYHVAAGRRVFIQLSADLAL